MIRCDPRTVRFELLWLAHKGVNLSQVANLLCFNPSTVRSALHVLIKEGYLDENLNLTPKGEERVRKCLSLIAFDVKRPPLVDLGGCLIPSIRLALCNKDVRCALGKYSEIERFPKTSSEGAKTSPRANA